MQPNKCDSCERHFQTPTACYQHMSFLGHWIWPNFCETCPSRFMHEDDAVKHMMLEDHRHKPYPCETCPETWWSPHERDQHQADTGHYSHLHCADCDRYFQNTNNLSQHRKSRLHQGTSVHCPFCESAFVTASGLSQHIETSACPQARLLDRSKVWQFLRRRDPQGVFTERLLTYPGSDLSDYWDPCAAWNGSGYECYICHKQCQTTAWP